MQRSKAIVTRNGRVNSAKALGLTPYPGPTEAENPRRMRPQLKNRRRVVQLKGPDLTPSLPPRAYLAHPASPPS